MNYRPSDSSRNSGYGWLLGFTRGVLHTYYIRMTTAFLLLWEPTAEFAVELA